MNSLAIFLGLLYLSGDLLGFRFGLKMSYEGMDV